MSDGEFSGRVCLITGGTGAIGSAIADEVARRGGSLALVYRTNEARAARVAASLAPRGQPVNLFRADVGRADEVKRLAEDVRVRCGEVDVLIHAAGTRLDGSLVMMTDDRWAEVLRSSLDAAFFCARAFLRDMIARRRGAIVLVASASALHGVAGQSNYSAAKSGLLGLTRSLAAEVGRFGIRVNAVAPGFVESDMTTDLDAAQRERLLAATALGRAGGTAEVARVAAFLAGEASSYVTGQVVAVDGGIS